MEPPKTMPFYLNPLRWLEADTHAGTLSQAHLDDRSAIRWLCSTTADPSIDVLQQRYAMASQHDRTAHLFPYETRLAEKVLIPIQQVKAAYVLGHHLTCIALAGMVAEMLTVFRFRVALEYSSDKSSEWPSEDAFDKERQQDRIKRLRSLKIIDGATADALDRVRQTRRRYLHQFDHPHEQLAQDAEKCYADVVAATWSALELRILETGASMHPDVVRWLSVPPT